MYCYITKNNLEDRQKYQYTTFGGKEFIREYQQSRAAFAGQELSPVQIRAIEEYYQSLKVMAERRIDEIELYFYLCTQWEELNEQESSPQQDERLHAVVKTFEVRKRLYIRYSGKFKPHNEEDYKDVRLYLLFADVVAKAYTFTQNLKYLSALLKCNDILLSIPDQLLNRTEHRDILCRVVNIELRAVEELLRAKKIRL